MIEIGFGLVVSAFIAGILMFLAPCTLPLVPAYLAFIGGVKESDLRDPTRKLKARQAIVLNGFFFVVGFSLVFVLFGMLAGYFGAVIGQLRGVLTHLGGVFIILFGLMMLDLIHISPLMKDYQVTLPKALYPGNPLSATLIGATFALGWTPCVGPVLASVLLLASTQATVASGGVLLLIFSLGLAIPFLLTALLYSRATHVIARYSGGVLFVSRLGGLFLIGIGLLLLFDEFGLTIQYGYRFFNWFGYEALLNYF